MGGMERRNLAQRKCTSREKVADSVAHLLRAQDCSGQNKRLPRVSCTMLGPLLVLSLLSVVAPGPPPSGGCRRCCDHLEPPEGTRDRSARFSQVPEVRTFVNMTILKGDKGDRGDRGTPGKVGMDGPPGSRGPSGTKGSKGIYFFNVNIHTWNFKETYLHIMLNDSEKAIIYAQPSDRSIMQSQSIMLELALKDEVWVRLYKRERENAIYSDDVDVYITFNGYLLTARN
ncbi:hypothetical protein WMY93_002758 [Mugilogobius chulae]|uniref:C1q domain-containing protein n=1 Tax=Mugilogobius chulae TaxID=88201 RepID=A0AAW0Q5D9_9GOBI